MDDRIDAPVDGEWECDNCGYIKVGVSTKQPNPRCPECGEADFTFYEYSDDADWDDEDENWDA